MISIRIIEKYYVRDILINLIEYTWFLNKIADLYSETRCL